MATVMRGTEFATELANWRAMCAGEQDLLLYPELFGEGKDLAYPDEFFGNMARNQQNLYLMLTRNARRMREYLTWQDICSTAPPRDLVDRIGIAMNIQEGLPPATPRQVPGWGAGGKGCLPNLWIGAAVGSGREADECRAHLLAAPACVRVLAIELPWPDAVDLTNFLSIRWQCSGCQNYFAGVYRKVCPLCGRDRYWSGSHAFNPPGGQTGPGVNWVVAGGRRGPGAEPVDPDAVRYIRDQCAAARVPFTFTGWGEWMPDFDPLPDPSVPVALVGSTLMRHTDPGQSGRMLDGRIWDDRPHTL